MMISDLDFEERLKSARTTFLSPLSFPCCVKAKMDELDLSIKAFAEKARLSETTIRRVLRSGDRHRDYSYDLIIRVALVLRIDPVALDYFVGMAGRCFNKVSLGYPLYYLNAYDMDLSDALDWLEQLEAKGLLPKD